MQMRLLEGTSLPPTHPQQGPHSHRLCPSSTHPPTHPGNLQTAQGMDDGSLPKETNKAVAELYSPTHPPISIYKKQAT